MLDWARGDKPSLGDPAVVGAPVREFIGEVCDRQADVAGGGAAAQAGTAPKHRPAAQVIAVEPPKEPTEEDEVKERRQITRKAAPARWRQPKR